MSDKPAFAIVGLGKIGGNLARHALDRGFRVLGYTLGGPARDLIDGGLEPLGALSDLKSALDGPRRVFLYVPAGPAVDETLDGLIQTLEAGDVIVDGGNSYWGDSIRRHDRLAAHGLHFVDMGTSGGVEGARQGACLMAGGDAAAIAPVEPILRALAVQGGYAHVGPPGAGHFVKLVHNGIEFAMLQALGEGFQLLTHYRERLDVGGVLECWRHGSVIRSWLVDLLARAYAADPGLKKPGAHIEDTGEVNWLVADALNMEVPVPVIAQSVMQLFASRDAGRDWARAIVAMRHEFGGHPYGNDEKIAEERRTSRVGEIISAE